VPRDNRDDRRVRVYSFAKIMRILKVVLPANLPKPASEIDFSRHKLAQSFLLGSRILRAPFQRPPRNRLDGGVEAVAARKAGLGRRNGRGTFE